MTYYLVFILCLFQTREMILDKKQIGAVFLFKFKMGCKAVETTHNINNTFGLWTASKYTVQWLFKNFAKEMRTLKIRSVEASHWKLTTTNWEDHQSWLSYTRSCQRTQCQPFYGHSAPEANWKGAKPREVGTSHACVLSHFSCVWLFETPWTGAHQVPLSMGFSKQEY